MLLDSLFRVKNQSKTYFQLSYDWTKPIRIKKYYLMPSKLFCLLLLLQIYLFSFIFFHSFPPVFISFGYSELLTIAPLEWMVCFKEWTVWGVKKKRVNGMVFLGIQCNKLDMNFRQVAIAVVKINHFCSAIWHHSESQVDKKMTW